MKSLIQRRLLFVMIIAAALTGILFRNLPLTGSQDRAAGIAAMVDSKPAPAPVEFIGEHVTIDVFRDSIAVTGIYRFRVNDNELKKIPILYPFPVDEHHEYPRHIEVRDGAGNQVTFMGNGASPAIHFLCELSEEPTFTVSYSQHITGPLARYILTTTATWGKPLQRAEFTVAMPEEFQSLSFSYEPDSEEIIHGRRTFSLVRQGFMPDRDMIITWNER